MSDLLALNSLLTENHERDDERAGGGGGAMVTPASFGAPRRAVAESSVGDPTRKKKDPKDIWDEDEIPSEEAMLAEEINDGRPRPKYDILYKQAVGTEDVFLGLGDKTPGSADCTHM